MKCKPHASLRMVDGGDWQSRQDLKNAETAASSIVKDASQQQGEATVAASLAPKPAPAPTVSTSSQSIGSAPVGSATPGATPIGSEQPSGFGASPNKYTTAPAPLTPIAGGAITRVGNSFSNVSSPSDNPIYGGLKMDPNDPGNRSALSGIKSLGFKNGGQLRTGDGGNVPGSGRGDKIDAKYEPGEFVVSNAMLDSSPGLREMLSSLREKTLAAQGKTVAQADAGAIDSSGVKAKDGYSDVDERDKLIEQIPNSSPEDWSGGSGEKVSGNDFTRAAGNTLNAVAPLAVGSALPVAVNAASKAAGPLLGALKSTAMANTVGYGTPVAAGAALLSAANQPTPRTSTPKTSPAPAVLTDVQRGGASAPSVSQPVQIEASGTSLPAAPPPIAAGAVKTQGQMNMEADLRSAEAMKAERLAAESRAPQATVTHSGNDWQARNNLRNLEVSASSMTAQPKDLMAYDIARKHDTQLQGGSTAADVANVAAANRHNEINSTAQVANARTAQQGQQFGASHELATQRLALDSKTQGAQASEYGAQARLKTVQANAAEQLAALQNRYMSAKPEEQAAIAKQIQTISGKQEKAQLHTVNQPDTMAPDGMTKLGGGQRLVVQGSDGSFHEVPIGSEKQAGPPVISSPDQLAKLPKGTVFIGPDGKQHRKD